MKTYLSGPMDCQAHMRDGELDAERQVPGIVIVEIDPKSHGWQARPL